MSGECDNKDSVWETLQKEVLYSVVLQCITWKVVNQKFYFIPLLKKIMWVIGVLIRTAVGD